MRYPLAERFLAPQGEGLYAGAQMAFVRTVGCSVGKQICVACDTDFDKSYPALGGGIYSTDELMEWAGPARHVCVTGGEPLDRDLRPLIRAFDGRALVHVETSGTRHPDWLDLRGQPRQQGMHAIGEPVVDRVAWRWAPLWVTVCPKPGFLPEMVERVADEVKVIAGGLGDGPGWPTLDDALRWADMGLLVYWQPRNFRDAVDRDALDEALATVAKHPQLRLSCQLHKFLRTR